MENERADRFFNPTSRFRRIESKSRVLPSIQLFHPSTAYLLLLCLGLQKLITSLEGGGRGSCCCASVVFGVPCKVNWQDPCATLAAPGPNGLAPNLNPVTSLDLASKNLPQRRTFSHTVRLRTGLAVRVPLFCPLDFWIACQILVNSHLPFAQLINQPDLSVPERGIPSAIASSH